MAESRTTIAHPLKIFYVKSPFQSFFRKVATGGFLLLSATVLALIWANIDPHGYHTFWHMPLSIAIGPISFSKSLLEWIDEALMALFFFTVGLEIKREILVGELATFRRAILPVAAAVGGMIVPAVIYTVMNAGGDGAHGWGIPMATDIAFALAVLSLVTKRVPFGVRIFLSALAIADDIGAVLVIAIFYTKAIAVNYLLIAGLFLAGLAAVNLLWVRKTLIYALLGIGMWFAVLGSGIHATVAGVFVALFIPARGKYDTGTFIREVTTYLGKIDCQDESCGYTILLDQTHLNAVQAIEEACHQTETPLQRLGHFFNTWVALCILPLFALANAGIIVTGIDLPRAILHSVTLGVALGLIIGKPLGIFLFSFLTSKLLKSPLSSGVSWLHILGASMLGGIGFTMSIFISGLSFKTEALMEMSKLGIILGSLISAVLGLSVLLFSHRLSKKAEKAY